MSKNKPNRECECGAVADVQVSAGWSCRRCAEANAEADRALAKSVKVQRLADPTPPDERQTCGNCGHFFGDLRCHAHPPTPNLRYSETSVYPPVQETAKACGEWKSK